MIGPQPIEITLALGPHQIVDAVHVLEVHRDALETIGDLAGDRPAVEAADLLEIGELADLHAVQPHLPTETPGAQGRRFPVVLHEADVVHQRVDAERAQGIQVALLNVGGRGFQDDLELVVTLQAVGVLAVAPIGGTPRRLHIGRAPGLRTDGAQEGGGVKGPRAHLHIVGLLQDAALSGPVLLEHQDQVLKVRGLCAPGIAGRPGGRRVRHRSRKYTARGCASAPASFRSQW